MIPKNDKTKNHYPYYYFGKIVDSTDVANNSALIKTFDQRLYINYGNGLCVKRMKNASSHVNKVIELELIPITSIYSQIKWSKDSNGNLQYGRKRKNDHLVKVQMRKK